MNMFFEEFEKDYPSEKLKDIIRNSFSPYIAILLKKIEKTENPQDIHSHIQSIECQCEMLKCEVLKSEILSHDTEPPDDYHKQHTPNAPSNVRALRRTA